MAVKTAARKRVGYREPRAAVVPAAKMRVAEAVASTAEMAVASTTEMAAAMTTTAMAAAAVTAAAPADRSTRQQRRQNKDCNSDCRFGHGTLLRHAADAAALERRRQEVKVPLAGPARARLRLKGADRRAAIS